MAAIKRSFLGSLMSERVFSFGVLAGLLSPDDFDLIGSLREVQRAWVSFPQRREPVPQRPLRRNDPFTCHYQAAGRITKAILIFRLTDYNPHGSKRAARLECLLIPRLRAFPEKGYAGFATR